MSTQTAQPRRRKFGLTMVIPPLRPDFAEASGAQGLAERKPTTHGGEKEIWVQPTLDGSVHLVSEASRPRQRNELAPDKQRDADGQLMLGLTPQSAHEPVPAQVTRIRKNARTAQAKLDDLTTMPLPQGEGDGMSPGLAWPAEAKRERAAVLQPPKPEVVSSSRVLEHYRAGIRAGAGHDEPERG